MVENVNRHLEEGQKPFPAAILAARELGGPIIAMTVVLIAVYVPIGLQRGLTGACSPNSPSPWWSRHHLGDRGAHPVADDVLAHAEAA